MYISNDCVFPVGWTIETLMEHHRSQPYNPNIANGFFRAGYVETWGRGIEKYVKFTPLGQKNFLKDQNVLINDLLDDSLEKIILSAIRENPHITQAQLATKLNRSDRQEDSKIVVFWRKRIPAERGVAGGSSRSLSAVLCFPCLWHLV